MKTCTQCSASIENDAARYCPFCSALQEVTAPAPGYQAPTAPYQFGGNPPPTPRGYLPPATPAVCSAGYSVLVRGLTSPYFLALVIAYTVTVACSVVSLFSSDALLQSLFALGGYAEDLVGFSIGYKIAMLLSLGVTTLTCVAFWLCYMAGRAAQQGAVMPQRGFRLLRLSSHLQFAWGCVVIMLTVLVIGLFLFTAAAFGSFSMSEMNVIIWVCIVVMMLVIGIMFALYFLNYRKSLKTITSLQHTAATGYPTTYVSTFVIVMYLLSGVSFCINILTLSMTGIAHWTDLITLLAFLSSGVHSLLLGMCLLRYRKQMQEISAAVYYGLLQ